MSDHFSDRLMSAIERKGNPVCVGIDPMIDLIPDSLKGDTHLAGSVEHDAALDVIHDFCREVLQIVAPLVPIVKFQSAYFEKYYWEGVQLYYELIAEAKQLGLMTIGDVKRGDIGSTSAAYAEGHLADLDPDVAEDAATPDAITINPMLGPDTLEPFLDAAVGYRKGLFVLVRTSNPGSTKFQDVKLDDGRTWSEMLADTLQPIAENMVGARGVSALGAVVGATQTESMQNLRRRLPKSIFLLPGYGTQGATGEMMRAAFDHGSHAIVSASRSILYAGREKKYCEKDWKTCVRDATTAMIAELKTLA